MSVVVRNRARRRYPLRRTARRLQAIAGGIMVTIAAITGTSCMIISGLLFSTIWGGTQDGSLSAEGQVILFQLGRVWLIVTLITLSGWATGMSLLHGRRRTVLWLRRFRDHNGIRVVTDALDHIGRSWRVVTLDDRTARPIGVASGLRAASGVLGFLNRILPRLLDVAFIVGLALHKICLVAIAAVVGWSVYQGRFLELLHSLHRTWDDWSGPTMVLALRVPIAILISEYALLLAWLAVYVAAMPFIGVFIMIGDVSNDVKKAEQSKIGRVQSPSDVEPIAVSVEQAGRQILAARLTVLMVDTSVWQLTVEALERRCCAVLVDVSQVSENLLWELRRLATRTSGVVYVGESSALVALERADPDDTVRLLQEALDGCEVLAYTNSWWGRILFQQSLFADLEAAAPKNAVNARSMLRVVWLLVGTACLSYGLVQAAPYVRLLIARAHDISCTDFCVACWSC